MCLALVGFAGDARAHGVPPVSKQILFHGNQLLVPTRGWGVFVGADDAPDGGDATGWQWICDEAINKDLDRVWARSGDGTFHVTDYLGVTTSRDGGCTWVPSTGTLAERRPSTVVADPVDPRGAWVPTYGTDGVDEALFHTTDDGLTWTPAFSADENLRGVALSTDGRTIYLVGFPRGADAGSGPPLVHVSRDGGLTFATMPLAYTVGGAAPLDAFPLAVDPSDPSVAWLAVYVEPVRALVRLDGFGATSSESLRLVGADLGNVAFADGWPASGPMYAGSYLGLYRSTDGRSFQPVGDLHVAQCVAPHGDRLYACSWNFAPDEKAVARADDGQHFRAIFRYGDTTGPTTACPAGTPVATICPSSWFLYSCQLGVACDNGPDAGAAISTGGGGCSCGNGGSGGGTVKMQTALLLALALARLGRRSRR